MNRISLALILGTLSLTSVVAQSSQDALTTLAVKITEKRTQVETLSNDLDLLKAGYNEQLRSLAAQKADVETQINREKLRLDQLDRDLAEVRNRMQANRDKLGDSLPLVKSVLERTRKHIQAGIPFQVPGRVAEVESLERLLEGGGVEAGTLLARAWNLLEAEYRLSGENGLYRQTIEVDGREQLVEVARLGMVFLYFRTPDGKVGASIPADTGWTYRAETRPEARKQIEVLFDSLRKNLKEGYFPLPHPLHVNEVTR